MAYDVSESLGGYLVTCGHADVAPASASVVDPDEDQGDSSIFGGVIVALPIERAADDTPRKRRRTRRGSKR